MSKKVSIEELAKEVEWRHNSCFVCQKQFEKDPDETPIITLTLCRKFSCRNNFPWKVSISQVQYMCHYDKHHHIDHVLYNKISVHTECFVDSAGADWRFW